MSVFLLDSLVVFLFIEFVILLLNSINQVIVLKILKYWDFNASNTFQYSLEKKNYLVNTIITFTIGVKIILFIFFVKSLDDLVPLVPGAMCATGVIGANEYGNILLLFKIFILFLLGVWMIINRLDLKSKELKFLKKKYYLFTIVFIMICIEFILELAYFINIPLTVPVFCCSVVFVVENLPFDLTTLDIVYIFYFIFVSILASNYYKKISISFILNILFLFVSYYSVTYFFGTYVYEEPNHKCPFCFLQADYYYVGYLIWSTLFVGIFFGISPYIVYSIVEIKNKKLLQYNSIILTVFTVICSSYVLFYYIKNGVFL